MVYFDNAATTEMSGAALDALIKVSKDQYGNPSSMYGFGRKSRSLLEEARRIIAKCIGAESNEIFFTSGGTESDNWVINQTYGTVKKVITSQIEHHAILQPIHNFRATDVDVVYVPVDANCVVKYDELQKCLDGSKSLVSIMMQNNETGVLQDVSELAKLVHDNNSQSIFHTDAVQAVGHTFIDVRKLGVDMLSASAHKFNGPKGVGFLYVSSKCEITPLILGGGQEREMRSGTENVAGIYSMAKALEDNVKKLEEIREHIQMMEQMLLDGLRCEDVLYRINGDLGRKAVGILNIAIEGTDGEGLFNMLDMHDICISIGSACNSRSKDRSHVLEAMGLDDDRIDSSVRISIGRYNTEEDIYALVKCIKKYCEITNIAR